MGAKASTPANSGHQSPRTRTFSTSSSTEVTSPPGSGPGFNLLRALPGIQVPQNDRQRARSLSSVPDLQQSANNNNSNSSNHNHHHLGHNERGIPVINRATTGSSGTVVVSTANSVDVADRIIYGGHSILLNGATNGGAISLEQVEEAGIVDGIAASVSASTSAMGRVYTATSQIWQRI